MLRLLIVGWLLIMPSMAMADVKVLTSIKPLQLIAEAITEGVSTSATEALLPIGASAHHYSLRPSDMSKLQGADLFYWIGPEMEVFLVKALQRRDKNTTAVHTLPEIYLRTFDAHDTQDEHDHDHPANTTDLHLWLSSVNAKVIAKKMAADLSLIDPANQAIYEKNLLNFNKSIDSLDNYIKQQLANTPLKPFFVLHETYNYFEEAYGIKHQGVFSINASIQPGVRQIAQMQAQLKQTGESCVFYEPPMPPKLATTLTKGLPVQLVMLDAMGDNVTVNAKGYTSLLNNLLEALLHCKRT